MAVPPACRLVAVKADRLQTTALPADNFLQQEFWGQHKAEFGWEYQCLEIQCNFDGSLVFPHYVLVLKRLLKSGFFFLYIPHAPALQWVEMLEKSCHLNRANLLDMYAEAIKQIYGGKCLFVRFDLPWVIGSQPCREESETENSFSGESLRQNLDLHPLIKATTDIQPPDTVILDLQAGSAAILAGMKPKTRYNIRLSAKKGVRIENAGLEHFDAWYDLYRTTAERDNISIHSSTYYRNLINKNPDKLTLLLAYHEEDLIAGNIMMFSGNKATYLYGATSNIKRNLMPAYALQWAGINAALERSCLWYDFGGLPPTNNPQHPMHGLFQFKTGFGGVLVSFPGSWDKPFSPILYFLLTLAEKIRKFYYTRFKKKL